MDGIATVSGTRWGHNEFGGKLIELEVHVDISGDSWINRSGVEKNLEINDVHQQIDDNYSMGLGAK